MLGSSRKFTYDIIGEPSTLDNNGLNLNMLICNDEALAWTDKSIIYTFVIGLLNETSACITY